MLHQKLCVKNKFLLGAHIFSERKRTTSIEFLWTIYFQYNVLQSHYWFLWGKNAFSCRIKDIIIFICTQNKKGNNQPNHLRGLFFQSIIIRKKGI